MMTYDLFSKVLASPLISEKATRLESRNNVVSFWVDPKSTKKEIKQAVETFFEGVKVVAVQTLNQGARTVRFGKTEGRTKSAKKAYVTLAKGSHIDFSELE